MVDDPNRAHRLAANCIFLSLVIPCINKTTRSPPLGVDGGMTVPRLAEGGAVRDRRDHRRLYTSRMPLTGWQVACLRF